MYAAHRRHGVEGSLCQVKKTTLNPIWNETFAFPYSRGPDDSQPPELVIECEDVDTITAADFMGLVRVELDPLKDHKRLKKWLPLQARSDDKASSNISGDLEVFVKWRYNPELDFDPYPDSELKPAYEDKAPNELRLALVQARGGHQGQEPAEQGRFVDRCPRGAFETFLHAICVASMACELPDSMPSHPLPTATPSARRHRRDAVGADAVGATLSARRRDVVPDAYARWRACATSTPSTRCHPGRRRHPGSSDPFAKFEVTGGDSVEEALQIANEIQDALPALERAVPGAAQEGRGPASIGSFAVRRR